MAVYGDWVDALGERIGAPGEFMKLEKYSLIAYFGSIIHKLN